MGKRFKFSILLLFLALVGCEYDSFSRYDMGDSFVNDPTQAIMIDTFTVETYTIGTDSVATSYLNRLMAGLCQDNYGVKTYCESYFRLVPSSIPEINDYATYDSAAIVLHFDGYYEGDTTKVAQFAIYQVLDSITPREDETYIYSNRKFQTESEPFATFTVDFSTFNDKKDSIVAIIPKDKAYIFYRMAYDESDTLDSSDDFLDVFKGFAIKPYGTTPAFVAGFAAYAYSASAPYMAVYYHDRSVSDHLQLRFKLESTVGGSTSSSTKNIYASTYISNDYSESIFKDFKTEENRLPSISTNNVSMIQAGADVSTCIVIPNIDKLKDLGMGEVLKAQLYFEPIDGSYDDYNYELPASLEMFLINEDNDVEGKLPLMDSEERAYAKLYYDEMYNSKVYYKFDISRFVKDEYDSESVSFYALALSFPTASVSYSVTTDYGNTYSYKQTNLVTNSVDRLFIGNAHNKEHKMELRIYMSLIE
jgi:hypothetical protein